MSSVTAAVAAALQLHQGGKLAEAREAYEAILRVNPRHPDVLHLLGVLAHQSGNHRRGVELIRKAIQGDKSVAYYHNNLGECWRGLKDYEKAIACYRRALHLDPKSADATANLGTVFKHQGKFAEAVELYRTSLALRPGDARNLSNLGGVFCELRQYDEAQECFQQAVRAAPQMFEAWLGLGISLKEAGKSFPAVEALKKSVELRPTDLVALNNLGVTLSTIGHWKDSVAILQEAARIAPDDVRAYLHLGNLWRELHHHDRAEACYAKGIELGPDNPNLVNNFGLAAEDRGAFPEAVRRFERALALDPKSAAAWNNLAGAYWHMARADEAVATYRKSPGLGSAEGRVAWSNLIFTMQYSPSYGPGEIAQEARRWGDALIAALPTAKAAGPAWSQSERLRIAYMSPDLKGHPVGYFLVNILRHHDRGKFEVFCFHASSVEDEWTQRLKEVAEHWVSLVGLDDADAAREIERRGIHVLIDLSGHTAGNRLGVMAHRPAPLQATYLGYPGSTGLRTVDFRISDGLADPPESTVGHYTEKLLILDRCAWCYEAPSQASIAPTPPMVTRGAVTFGCFNNYAKVSEELLGRWAQLLNDVGGARLVIKAEPFGDAEFLKETYARFARHGILAGQLEFRPRVIGLDGHFDTYNQIDIALDTYPYNGTTTTCDALWMGVPVISWRGDRHSSRVGASLLNAVGLDGLVAGTGEAYVKLAVELAKNPGQLSAWRAGLRQEMRASPLMDGVGLARALERAFNENLPQQQR